MGNSLKILRSYSCYFKRNPAFIMTQKSADTIKRKINRWLISLIHYLCADANQAAGMTDLNILKDIRETNGVRDEFGFRDSLDMKKYESFIPL